MTHPLYPYEPLVELLPDLWQLTGTLAMPLKRHMTVVRLASGELLLHSVVAMDDAGHAALEALGRPAVMVIPHPFHTLDAAFYKDRYPELVVVAAEDTRAKLDGALAIDATPEEALPALQITPHRAPGMRYGEIVIEVPVSGGRALLFTDLLGHKPKGLMMRLLGAPGGTGVPRIVRFRQVDDRAAVRAFFTRLAAIPELVALTGAHGDPILADCASALKVAATSL